jgi:hypothetical protein
VKFSNRRELTFHISLTIHELTHVPAGYRTLYAKWKTSGNTAHACTGKHRISDNTVTWEDTFEFDCELTVNNATNVMDSCPVRISIRQDTRSCSGFDRIGVAVIDLSEYAGNWKKTRRYLLQSSSFNSTLKVTVQTRQLSGDPLFKTRPTTDSVEAPSALQSHSAYAPPTRQGISCDQIFGICCSTLPVKTNLQPVQNKCTEAEICSNIAEQMDTICLAPSAPRHANLRAGHRHRQFTRSEGDFFNQQHTNSTSCSWLVTCEKKEQEQKKEEEPLTVFSAIT